MVYGRYYIIRNVHLGLITRILISVVYILKPDKRRRIYIMPVYLYLKERVLPNN